MPAYNSYIDQAKGPKIRSKIQARLVERRYHKGIVLSPISRVTGRAHMTTVNELVWSHGVNMAKCGRE